MAVFSLKFIGFEMTPTLIEETNFPASKIWKVILASLFIPALLYSFVVLAMGGMAPWHEIAFHHTDGVLDVQRPGALWRRAAEPASQGVHEG